MSAVPYPLNGFVFDTDGTTKLSNVLVRARNESTNETIGGNTNSLGEYVLDASSFPSGYTGGDTVSLFVIYRNSEATASVTISGEEAVKDLTLETVSAPADLHYCTVQDVYDALDGLTSSDIVPNKVAKLIRRSEREIEDFTESKFYSVTVTDEVYDFNQHTSWKSSEQLFGMSSAAGRSDYWNLFTNDQFQLKNYPVISITTLQKNSAGAASADSWTTLTEQSGSGGSFIVDLSTGNIVFVDNYPRYGKRSVRVTYVHGRATTPKTVERLAVLLTVKQIIYQKAGNSQFTSVDDITVETISVRKGISQTVGFLQQLEAEIKSLWNVVGTFKNRVV